MKGVLAWAQGPWQQVRGGIAQAQAGLHRLRAALGPWATRRTFGPEGIRALVATARRRPRRAAAVVAAGVLGCAGLLYVAWSRTPPEGLAVTRVQEGPFEVAIVEAGTLQALRSVTYASSIQSNQAKIIALAPEGQLVKKGDLLILFDAAPFEEEIRRSQAALAQAEAELAKAQQDLKLQEIQNREELGVARQKVEQSKLELKDVRQGKGLLKEEEADAAVSNAERELEKAQGIADDLRPLLSEGFITKQELERAEQQVRKAEQDLELTRRRRDALREFGRPIELAQARSAASLSEDGLRQLERATEFRLEQRRAAISAAESRIEEANAKLALARQQLQHTEVRADVPGIVVYRKVFFGSEQRKPQVGDQVWANQPLLILPDISRMVVESQVRETDIHKVERNQKVTVRVDAYPELRLTGRVTLVGTLAQEERERRGAKYFGITVELNESEPRLRPGMSARLEIEVEKRPRARYVPLEAVFERDGESVCYVVEGRRVVRRAVTLGPSNEDFVVIERGLERGERVALRAPDAPPSDFGSVTGS